MIKEMPPAEPFSAADGKSDGISRKFCTYSQRLGPLLTSALECDTMSHS